MRRDASRAGRSSHGQWDPQALPVQEGVPQSTRAATPRNTRSARIKEEPMYFVCFPMGVFFLPLPMGTEVLAHLNSSPRCMQSCKKKQLIKTLSPRPWDWAALVLFTPLGQMVRRLPLANSFALSRCPELALSQQGSSWRSGTCHKHLYLPLHLAQDTQRPQGLGGEWQTGRARFLSLPPCS